MTEVIGMGKNVEKAIEDALVQLKTSRDNVDIKILETGGLFKKAKVQVSISEDFLQEYKKKEKQKQELLKETKTEVKQEQKQQEQKQGLKKIYEKVFEEEKKENKKEQTVSALEIKPKQEKVEPKQAKVEVKAEPKIEDKKEEKEEKEEKTITENVEEKSEAQRGKEFLDSFIRMASINAVVDVFEDDNEIFYTILGEEATALIGYRGESLNSLQFLVSVLNGKNNRRNKRVRIDIDGYREKRQGTLEMLARRVARKVQKTGKQTRLEPMSAFERRIIHTIVQEFEGVSSISRGEEPHRYLIIRSDEKKEVKENKEQSENKETNEDN